MEKISLIINLVLIAFLVCCTPTPTPSDSKNLVISEICTNNKSIHYIDDYEYLDYIEIYNPNDKNVHLWNYGISDNEDELHRYKFSNMWIAANSYILVYFDKEYTGDNMMVAKFNISDTDKYMYLSDSKGNIVDKIENVELEPDTSYGRYNDSIEILNPSPGEKNELMPRYKKISAPTFSHVSGFYDKEFELVLTAENNVDIYYTIDCSDPTEKSKKYKDTISIKDPSKNDNVLKSRTDTSARGYSTTSPVDKAFIVRAIAIDKEGNKSDVVTHSYFVNKSYKKEKVVSLVTDSSNLIDENKGIYVTGKAYNDYVKNGSQGKAPLYNWDGTGREWEREANFTLIGENKKLDFSQDVGIRIHGYGGRTTQIKSFNVYARDSYDGKYFDKPIFDGVDYTKSIVLKYDRYSNNSEKYRDGFLQDVMSNTYVDNQKYEMCYLFLNGEYWAEYMIMQKYTDDYIEEKYDIPKEDVVIIKEGELEEGTDQDLADYKDLIQFARTKDLSKEKNYNELEERVDIMSFIDFYATQLYYNHFDFSYNKNVLVWKSRTKGDKSKQDGKWRWMLYDFDYAAVNRDVTKTSGDEPITIRYDYAYNTFTGTNLFAGDFKNDVFFHSFMKNNEFKELFINRFMDLANNNYSSENIKEKLLNEQSKSNTTINEFFEKRFEYITKYLAEYAKIDSTLVTINIKTNKRISFNTLSIDKDYSGKYYKGSYITINTLGNSYKLEGLKEISNNNGLLVLEITNNNPNIEIL